MNTTQATVTNRQSIRESTLKPGHAVNLHAVRCGGNGELNGRALAGGNRGRTRQWMFVLPLLRYSGQGSGILGSETRTGNRLRPPVSDVRRECRGSVRGALSTVRTARAVCSHLTIICIPGGVSHSSFPASILPSYSSARPIATL